MKLWLLFHWDYDSSLSRAVNWSVGTVKLQPTQQIAGIVPLWETSNTLFATFSGWLRKSPCKGGKGGVFWIPKPPMHDTHSDVIEIDAACDKKSIEFVLETRRQYSMMIFSAIDRLYTSNQNALAGE